MIRKAFRNMSFRKKCLAACLLVSMIPMILLGSFCYRQMHSVLLERETTALEDTLLRESGLLNEKLNRYVQGLHYVCWNNNLNLELSQSFAYNSQMYLFYRDTLDPLLLSTKALNPEIYNITLFTDIAINPHGSTLRPLTDVQQEAWFEVVCRDYLDHWILSEESKTISLASCVYDIPEDKTALVKMDFTYESTFSSMRTLYDQAYGIVLTDGQGSTIYSFHTEDMADKILTAEQLAARASGTNGYVVESASEIGDSWTLYLYRPLDTLLGPVREIVLLILVIILLCLLFVVLVSFFLSAGIVQPLEKLTAQMKQVEQGVLVSRTDYDSLDEIGSLSKAFNHMLKRLNGLIDQLIQEKVLQKEYEMRALQAQINPHFLYNSLSLINSKAILAEQQEISQMAQFLSTFYRTTLNKGKSITFVRDELDNVCSYVRIQLLMHNHSFDVAYDIAEEILERRMPNLLLQPLVENAIEHGLDRLESGKRGMLRIDGCLEGDTIIFRVSDNGPGIPQEKLDSILQISADSGYGIPNVHQRVQLLFGADYGLSYENSPSGTTASLRLPIEQPREIQPDQPEDR